MKHYEAKLMKNTSELKPDPVLKDYWRNNSRFSDLFNQIFFSGEESIQPDKLSDKDTEESAVIMEKGRTTSISCRCEMQVTCINSRIKTIVIFSQ